jgi:hypothetical protein
VGTQFAKTGGFMGATDPRPTRASPSELSSGPLDITAYCPLAIALASRLRAQREELTQRWLERIASRVSIDANKVFPTDELLNHVPLLMEGIADYLENPAHVIGADTPVVGKAMELGALRLAQGFEWSSAPSGSRRASTSTSC